MAINGNFVERPQRAFSFQHPVRPKLVEQREFARRRDGPQFTKLGVTDRNGRCARSCCRCHSEHQRPKACCKGGTADTIGASPDQPALAIAAGYTSHFNALVAQTGVWVHSVRFFPTDGKIWYACRELL